MTLNRKYEPNARLIRHLREARPFLPWLKPRAHPNATALRAWGSNQLDESRNRFVSAHLVFCDRCCGSADVAGALQVRPRN
jgi:hypothetical protein